MSEVKNPKGVAVALDAIRLLTLEESPLKAANGRYLACDADVPADEVGLQEIIPMMLQSGCSVCAKGAAVIAKTSLYNGTKAGDVKWCGQFNIPSSHQVDKLLEDVFSPKTLCLMEVAFERDAWFLDYGACKVEDVCGAIAFGHNYEEPKDRLIAVMRNIADNGGEIEIVPMSREAFDATGLSLDVDDDDDEDGWDPEDDEDDDEDFDDDFDLEEELDDEDDFEDDDDEEDEDDDDCDCDCCTGNCNCCD